MSTSIETAVKSAAEGLLIPGFVAAATRDGQTICEMSQGPIDQIGGGAMPIDAVFFIASMTKAITAVAAMQLVERGLIGLDEPVGDVLPMVAEVQVLEGFGADDEPILRAPKRPVTLAHLLTHTSGYAYAIWNADVVRFMAKRGTPDMGTGLNAALALPLMFDPGERWEYGIGIDIAGKLVEALSGQTLDAYVADHIFAPLDMASTAFRPTPEMSARQAGMNLRARDGGLSPIVLPLNQTPEFWSGGGGLYSTARDYLKFLNALLDGGAGANGPILRAETVKRMLRHRIAPVPLRRLGTANPFLSADLGLGAETDDWALSFQVNPEAGPHGRSAHSLAWAGLANTYYWVDPANRVAGVLMTQLLPFADPPMLDLFAAFERAVYTRP